MRIRVSGLAGICLLLALPLAAATGGIESSYHGKLGIGTGLGMLEKWCALPNFSFPDQGGVDGWVANGCGSCHIGASWNPTRSTANCVTCHGTMAPTAADAPTIDGCLTCHIKDTEKRGELFAATADVHLAAGMVCQDCHVRLTDADSDHQFAKGRIIDTTLPTAKGTVSCTNAGCHEALPHDAMTDRGAELNRHTAKVACETCHVGGSRPNWAFNARNWTAFTAEGKPVTTKRLAGFPPQYKWYDGTGPGAAGFYHVPILGVTERRDAPGAKIYPFNSIKVTWYVKKKKSKLDDVIPVPDVKKADANKDGVVTLEEMRKTYKQATLVSADMTFSISHGIRPAAEALICSDCHGCGETFDWIALGYNKDPRK